MQFKQVRAIEPTCGTFDCMVKYAEAVAAKKNAARAREESRLHREAKAKIKTRQQWMSEAQKIVNTYIRLRDAGKPCISCGTTNPAIQYAAGHYRSVGSASHLRFNHDNIWLQCNRHCNMMLSGNHLNYRVGLIAKIGLERVEALEADNTTHKWTRDELIGVIAEHKRLIKELKEKQVTE